MKRLIPILLIFCCGCVYLGYTKMTIEGDKLKKSALGGISGDKVKMVIERETRIGKEMVNATR